MPLPASQHDRRLALTPRRGFFLVLDGPDGGGKSTQIRRVSEWLRTQGFDVLTCRDPGGTELGEKVRNVLLERNAIPIASRAEMLLYMASRAQLVEEVIRPALEAGRVVIGDRFTYANIVYQGHAGGLGVAEVSRIGECATGGLQPDLTLILDISAEIARGRIGGARDRMEDRSLEFHRKVREGFLSAARAVERHRQREHLPTGAIVSEAEAAEDRIWSGIFRERTVSPVVVIDATAEADVVFAQIKSEVERGVAFGPRS